VALPLRAHAEDNRLINGQRIEVSGAWSSRDSTGQVEETHTGESEHGKLIEETDVFTMSSPLSPPHRFVIALHSPSASSETGLRMCPPEKGRQLDAIRSLTVRSLSSPLCGRNITKYGHLCVFLGKSGAVSLRWDSNSQYIFCHRHKRPCFRDLLRFDHMNGQTREADWVRPQDRVVPFLWPTEGRWLGDHRQEEAAVELLRLSEWLAV
jgi:hypothetical protein